jgi:hypothetical protein
MLMIRVEVTNLDPSECIAVAVDTIFRLAVACDWITVCTRYRGYDIGNQPSVEWQRPVTIFSLSE